MNHPRPLSDDWLSWDPEEIHRYPAGLPKRLGGGPGRDGEAAKAVGRRARRELLLYIGAGFAVGVVAAALLGLVVLLMPRESAAAVARDRAGAGEVTRGCRSLETGVATPRPRPPVAGTTAEPAAADRP